jgi:hypothetical protein
MSDPLETQVREFLTTKGLSLPAGVIELFCKLVSEDPEYLHNRGRIFVVGGTEIIQLVLEFKDWRFGKYRSALDHLSQE